MSAPSPQTVTYEQMMSLFREMGEKMMESRKEFDWRMKESELAREKSREDFDQRIKETDRIVKETNKSIGYLTDRIGELIEAMVEGGVVRLFQALGYEFTRCSRRLKFGKTEAGYAGEVDLFLENGGYAMLVEVKTHLSVEDVRDHIEKLQKYRIDADANGDKRRFIAAVGGGVVPTEVQKFALKQGFFVIQQSGENVEVLPPYGKPREW